MKKTKKKSKRSPQFKSEDEERDFWAKADTLEFFDFKSAQKMSFPNLKPSAKSISLRLPEEMLFELKKIANRKDVPYQSLIKLYLDQAIKKESA